jgi:hypothetical protein
VYKREIFFNKQVYHKRYFIKYGNLLSSFVIKYQKIFLFRDLADHDKDGRLTPDEFVVAMHCCDVIRAGQTLPTHLPDEWLNTNTMQRDRTGSLAKANVYQPFGIINQDLRDTFQSLNTRENDSPETVEAERRNSLVTYEEKRQKNYEVCI